MSEEKWSLCLHNEQVVSSYSHFLGKLQNIKKYIAEIRKKQKFLKNCGNAPCQIVSKDILYSTTPFILLYINSVVHINLLMSNRIY
jgi:hypothetical protein